MKFALYHALRSLGMPCLTKEAHGETSPEHAAHELHRAFHANTTTWTHLCPLDRASKLPPLKFGTTEMKRFSSEELGQLFNWERLKRHHAQALPSLHELSQFQWLVVRKTVALKQDLYSRTELVIETILNERDPARIEPHSSHLPAPVENALLFLLLAPWEDWIEMPEFGWRGFTLPWVYSYCDDLFVRPPLPQSARSLSWLLHGGHTPFGDVAEWDAPMELPLKDGIAQLPDLLSESAWERLQESLSSPLFETPVAHFMVRAFLSDGIDEFLAHLTMIEAALGTETDFFPPKMRTSHKGKGATIRMTSRVSGLLGACSEGETYYRLFNLRSAFIHGRALQSPISSKDRFEARRLARRVFQGLVIRATKEPMLSCRDDFLANTLDQGVAMGFKATSSSGKNSPKS
ncbi:hypothetical protein [Hydrogenophaga sp. NFH-34]|uniref:hypothetical protein n=1 Tax=Hydrogenophaga sp. NFH-34 TaxID=2744446 RepID=UPI001F25C765|nr:hypothetical protein [Hydrogenophaga sp. NFH-34]